MVPADGNSQHPRKIDPVLARSEYNMAGGSGQVRSRCSGSGEGKLRLA